MKLPFLFTLVLTVLTVSQAQAASTVAPAERAQTHVAPAERAQTHVTPAERAQTHVTPAERAQTPRQVVDAVIENLGPARDQGDTYLCAANAAADIATFHVGKRISTFSVVVRNFENRSLFESLAFNPSGVIASQLTDKSRYMLALGASTLSSLQGRTLCDDDQLNPALAYNDSTLKYLWKSYQEKYRSYIGPTPPHEVYKDINSMLQALAPSLDSGDFISHINRYQSLDVALGKWLDRSCHMILPAQKRYVIIAGERSLIGSTQLMAILNHALDAGEPALVHYDPGVFIAREPALAQSLIGFHVSVIMARQEIDGIPHYLLRNSWGSSCSSYPLEMYRRCDRGHLWLTESELKTYMTSVAFLKPASTH